MTEQTNRADAGTEQHIDCVLESTVEIFQATCGVDVRPMENCQNLNVDGIMLAVISVVGEVDWSIFLGIPKQTAQAVAQHFAGFEIPFESEDMGDAMGELANILAGQVKAKLDTRGVNAEISLPSVVRAQSMEVMIQRDSATMRTGFDSPLGKFWTGVVVGRNHGIIG